MHYNRNNLFGSWKLNRVYQTETTGQVYNQTTKKNTNSSVALCTGLTIIEVTRNLARSREAKGKDNLVSVPLHPASDLIDLSWVYQVGLQ